MAFFLNALPAGAQGGAASGEPAARCGARFEVALRELCAAAPYALQYAVVASYFFDENSPNLLEQEGVAAHLRTSRRGGLFIGSPNKFVPVLSGFTTAVPSNLAAYGSQHAKFIILSYCSSAANYPPFLRVAIFSNNLLQRDWLRKTGSLFVQDFPMLGGGVGAGAEGPRQEPLQSAAAAFREPLSRFLAALSSPGKSGKPSPNTLELRAILARADFSSAKAAIIASYPGVRGAEGGHLALRHALRAGQLAGPARIVAQVSSLGSAKLPFLRAFCDSCQGSARSGANDAQALAHVRKSLRVVLPSASFVRNSNEGWAAGDAVPLAADKVELLARGAELREYTSDVSGRALSSPHIKTFLSPVETETQGEAAPDGRIRWLLTGSHNLGPAAWGGHVNGQGEMVAPLSYELSVLLMPKLYAQGVRAEALAIEQRRLRASRFTATHQEVALAARCAAEPRTEPLFCALFAQPTVEHHHSTPASKRQRTNDSPGGQQRDAELLFHLPVPYRFLGDAPKMGQVWTHDLVPGLPGRNDDELLDRYGRSKEQGLRVGALSRVEAVPGGARAPAARHTPERREHDWGPAGQLLGAQALGVQVLGAGPPQAQAGGPDAATRRRVLLADAAQRRADGPSGAAGDASAGTSSAGYATTTPSTGTADSNKADRSTSAGWTAGSSSSATDSSPVVSVGGGRADPVCLLDEDAPD
jgi:hypothetical protein